MCGESLTFSFPLASIQLVLLAESENSIPLFPNHFLRVPPREVTIDVNHGLVKQISEILCGPESAACLVYHDRIGLKCTRLLLPGEEDDSGGEDVAGGGEGDEPTLDQNESMPASKSKSEPPSRTRKVSEPLMYSTLGTIFGQGILNVRASFMSGTAVFGDVLLTRCRAGIDAVRC